MIRPNMATMLGFVATDAVIAPALPSQLVREAADESFNRITIDGDTSTNDSFVLIATQQAGHARIDDLQSADGLKLREAVFAVSRELAHAIVRDGEGATKFITVQVDGGATSQSVGAWPTRSRIRRWSRRRSSRATQTWVGSSRRSAMPASRTSTRRRSICSSTTFIVARNGGGMPDYREEDGQR
jgi:glutamate N-acetyltransferase/amino-acid N-acetyltransferase